MHHDLDIHPIPEKVLYINVLSIADTAFGYETKKQHQKAITGKIHANGGILVHRFVNNYTNRVGCGFECAGIKTQA